MMNTRQQTRASTDFLSPLQLTLLAINAVCFGGSIVLLALGKGSVLLTVGTGLMFGGSLAGALIASLSIRRKALTTSGDATGKPKDG